MQRVEVLYTNQNELQWVLWMCPAQRGSHSPETGTHTSLAEDILSGLLVTTQTHLSWTLRGRMATLFITKVHLAISKGLMLQSALNNLVHKPCPSRLVMTYIHTDHCHGTLIYIKMFFCVSVHLHLEYWLNPNNC